MIRAFLLAAVVVVGVQQTAQAQTRGLEGTWTGGGSVTFASGARERARCRARFTRRSPTSYFVNATCATSSGRASQTAILRTAGQNSYRGRFYNSEYDVSGAILVVVRGNVQSVRLTGGNVSAFLQLSR
jgi:hypothetical protein